MAVNQCQQSILVHTDINISIHVVTYQELQTSSLYQHDQTTTQTKKLGKFVALLWCETPSR